MKTPLKSKLVNYTNCLKFSAQYLKYSAHQPLSKKSILRPFCPGLMKIQLINVIWVSIEVYFFIVITTKQQKYLKKDTFERNINILSKRYKK
jgi:hypothetical protein